MKKILFLITLAAGTLAAYAQPTSFAGITPGKTTREELKSLLVEPTTMYSVDFGKYALKQPDGMKVSIRFHNDVVYELKVDFDEYPHTYDLIRALMDKYGVPKTSTGEMSMQTCRSKSGHSHPAFIGATHRPWPAKDGVQGAVHERADGCPNGFIKRDYLLRHLPTFEALELAKLEQARKDVEERRRKLGNAL